MRTDAKAEIVLASCAKIKGLVWTLRVLILAQLGCMQTSECQIWWFCYSFKALIEILSHS